MAFERNVVRRPFLAASFLVVSLAYGGCTKARICGDPPPPPACLRTYWHCQKLYRETDWDGDGILAYAFPYTKLNTEVDRSTRHPIRYIDDALANASRDNPPSGTTVPKIGYIFVDVLGDVKTGAYRDGEGNYVRDYGLCAYPAVYGRTGRMTFLVDIEGTVYQKDTGGEPVTVFPDVEKEGWTTIGG